MPEGNLYAEYLEQQLLTHADVASLLAAAPQAGRMLRAVLRMIGRPVPEALRLPKAARRAPRPSRKRAARARAAPIADIPYRKQPPKSHYPRSVWPSEADLKRAGRQLAREARLKISSE